jgi:hypothetical protein
MTGGPDISLEDFASSQSARQLVIAHLSVVFDVKEPKTESFCRAWSACDPSSDTIYPSTDFDNSSDVNFSNPGAVNGLFSVYELLGGRDAVDPHAPLGKAVRRA